MGIVTECQSVRCTRVPLSVYRVNVVDGWRWRCKHRRLWNAWNHHDVTSLSLANAKQMSLWPKSVQMFTPNSQPAHLSIRTFRVYQYQFVTTGQCIK